jgi:hypothetical protein
MDSSLFDARWYRLIEVEDKILVAPRGAVAAVLDVAEAYRHLGFRPCDFGWFGIEHRGLVFVDTTLWFGGGPFANIFSRVMDAALRIVRHRLADELDDDAHWIDDTTLVRYAGPTPGLLDRVKSIFAELGFKLSDTKVFDFATLFVFLGFEWHFANKTVALPRVKVDRYLANIDRLLADAKNKAPTDLARIEEIVGQLVHVSFVIPAGKPQLHHLLRFKRSFGADAGRRERRLHLSSTAKGELHWWRRALEAPVVVRPLRARPPVDRSAIFTDACLSGIGIIFDCFGAHFELAPGWSHDLRARGGGGGNLVDACRDDIAPAEAWAVELAVLAAISLGKRDCTLVIRCDNQVVIGGLARWRSANTLVNESLARIEAQLTAHGLGLELVYIASGDNPADPMSRDQFAEWFEARRVLAFTQRIPIVVPDALRPYVTRVV